MSNMKYYAAELMVYFEKTRFLEVIRVLIIRLGIDRPLCVKHYLRKNLRKIANSVLTKNTIVHLPSQFDVEQFVRSCLQMYNIPTISYNTRGTRVDGNKLNEILRKFEKFCGKNGLQKKHKIYLNFPNNFEEVLQMESCESPPTNLIHVTADEPVEPDFKDVLDFYSSTVKDVPAMNGGGNRNIKESVVPEVMYTIKYSPTTVPYNIGTHFVYRVVIMGRQGSGRKTQAKMLAARYNLIYININSLIEQTLQSKDNLAKVLCVAFKKENKFSSSAVIAMLSRRLWQNDTLSKGWVIVGFPNCLNELEILLEKFQIPPNRMVVIHCSRNIALRRLIKQWERTKSPTEKMNTCAYVEEKFAQYDRNKSEIYKYLKASKTKSIHVDGSSGIRSLTKKMFALLER